MFSTRTARHLSKASLIGAVFGLALPLAACQSAQGPSSGDDLGGPKGDGRNADGTCIDPGSCANLDAGTTGNGNLPGGPNCGSQTVPLMSTKSEPNVLLVIDKSGSMDTEVGNTGVTRWDGLKSSLGAVLDQNTGKARWGLSMFPTGNQKNSCNAGVVDVPIALGDEASIKTAVDAYSTQQIGNLGGRTPTASTMQAVKSAGVLVDPTRSNYVVLMTDGEPNCGNADQVTPAIQALYAQSPSIRTFVIGFGSDVGASNLNQWAVAGHTDQSGATKYFVANTVADLETAFQSIVSGVASCTYQLQSPPADPSLVAPYIDNLAVASDAANGFTYDTGSQTVTFHGTSCEKVKSASKVDFVYGCPAAGIL